MSVDFVLDGVAVSVDADGTTLLTALREHLGIRSTKDGCSPQGQCGCCTVLVDGTPRVSCVTPLSRVAGRSVTTVEGLPDAARWAEAMCDAGASQCGFCTPGIIVRLSALDPVERAEPGAVDRALRAHLCRCTGWQTIREAAAAVDRPRATTTVRDTEAAQQRARIEGHATQRVGADVALGRGGFADDSAPGDALVALRRRDGEWVVGETIEEARAKAGHVQGRRTTVPTTWPLDVPAGAWDRTLQTTWVEPAALEPDASWCAPGGEPASPLGNGGAFGAKVTSPVEEVARRLAGLHGRTVRVLMTREDTVRLGPKRPPIAIGIRTDGSGIAHLVRPVDPDDEAALRASIGFVAPAVSVEFVEHHGPAVSASLRCAGWGEVAAVIASLESGSPFVHSPDGARARVSIDEVTGAVTIDVDAGEPLDEPVLRSYCIGAAHMALGMVRSESIALDSLGDPRDLTIRSFGIMSAIETPHLDVNVVASSRAPCNGSDAVFAATLAAAWRCAGHRQRWPI